MDHNGGTTPLVDRESLDTRLASHERALAALNAEQAQLMKQLETLKAERQVLQAVARKVATSRRLSDGTQQE
jgi:cell division protein FtsB